MWNDLAAFLAAIIGNWLLLVGGATLAIAGLVERFVLKRDVRGRWYAVILLLLLFVSFFSAWRDAVTQVRETIQELNTLKVDHARTLGENTALRIGVDERQRQLNTFFVAKSEPRNVSPSPQRPPSADSGKKPAPAPARQTVKTVAEPAHESSSAPPTIEQLRYVQKPISSPHQDAPYGLEVTVQTSVEMPSVTLNLMCDKPVAFVDFSPGPSFTGIIAGGAGPADGHPEVAVVTMTMPPFTPEQPLIVRIYSKEKVEVTQLRYRR